MDSIPENLLGGTARWGHVGYEGAPYSPPEEAYPGVDTKSPRYTTVEDTGSHPRRGPGLANLQPLIAAALWDAAFALEYGPLSTWNN